MLNNIRNDDWDKANRILCIRLDAMGDVLMTTPALRAIKENHPKRHLTLLTSPSGAAVARLVPEIDEIITYTAPWMKANASTIDRAEDFDMITSICDKSFDAAVIFTVYSQNPLPAALFCYLAGIPLCLAHCRENPYRLLSHWVKDEETESNWRHEVRRQLDLVATVGCHTRNEQMSLAVPPEARRYIDALLHELGIGTGLGASPYWVVIHPGATAASRRYPVESFAAAARMLVEQHGLEVLWTGSASEAVLVEKAARLMGLHSHKLAGLLSTAQLAALLEVAPVLISNNTGPVHIASALGTPVVDLYALTNPQHTPWNIDHRLLNASVPCRYCYQSVCPYGHQACLRLVPPEAVVSATIDLMESTQAFPPLRREVYSDVHFRNQRSIP